MILLDVDPNVVKPGWTAFVVVMLLAIAMVFLYLSMRKQFRKIHVPEDDESDNASDNAQESAPEPPPRHKAETGPE